MLGFIVLNAAGHVLYKVPRLLLKPPFLALTMDANKPKTLRRTFTSPLHQETRTVSAIVATTETCIDIMV